MGRTVWVVSLRTIVTTGEGCKPKVTVVLKGTLAADPGDAPTTLSVNVTKSNRHGRAYRDATQPTTVAVNDKTKVRRQGKKTADALEADDRVVVQARVCKADLAEGATPEERQYITKASNWLNDGMWNGSWHMRDMSRAKQEPAPGSMASQRTAAKCSEHALPLPCSSCIGDIRAGDDEVPRRLLAEHGPDARPDLAQHLNRNGAAA